MDVEEAAETAPTGAHEFALAVGPCEGVERWLVLADDTGRRWIVVAVYPGPEWLQVRLLRADATQRIMKGRPSCTRLILTHNRERFANTKVILAAEREAPGLMARVEAMLLAAPDWRVPTRETE